MTTPRSGPDSEHVLCHGYQGIDVISSRYPLASWNTLDAAQLAALVAAHEAWRGYDDFLIDTSGMSPRGVVACCMLSRAVVLVVTPQAQSQAEAFALLKVLRLNGFSSPVFLAINRAGATTGVAGPVAVVVALASFLQLTPAARPHTVSSRNEPRRSFSI